MTTGIKFFINVAICCAFSLGFMAAWLIKGGAMSYRENFDEFGNLRESHSPWTLADLACVAGVVGVIVVLMSGVLV